MASGGIMFLVQGVLGCIKAACGMHGLSSGKYRKFIFASGVIACSTFFQALLGMFSLNVDSAAAVIMFQVACDVEVAQPFRTVRAAHGHRDEGLLLARR